MGGTDLGDQKLSYYRSKLRSISWIPRILTHFLHISVVNAHILYTSCDPQNATMFLFDFQKSLIMSMGATFIEEINQDEPTIQSLLQLGPNNRQLATLSGDLTRLGCHGPPVTTRFNIDNPAWRDRGHCILCRKCVDVQCARCRKYLCIDFDGHNRTCWEIFHSERDLGSYRISATHTC